MRIGRRGALALVGAALGSRAAGAATWPERPVRVVVPYAPGGPTDIVARIVMERVGRELPHPVVIENRAGANGAIGAEVVARGAADGTVLLANASAHVIVPHLQRLPFDALTDFVPIANFAAVPLMLVVTPSLPARNLAELTALARAQPGRLSYASSAQGGAPHLAAELYKLMAGVDIVHVPYRGSGQALPDLMAGNVQIMFDSMPSSAAAVREGRLRALAVTTAGRQAAFPDLPTVAEAGLPGYEIATWYGLWAPPRVPVETVAAIGAAVRSALAASDVRDRLATLGAAPVGDTPEQFARFVVTEHERWGRLVRDARIRTE